MVGKIRHLAATEFHAIQLYSVQFIATQELLVALVLVIRTGSTVVTPLQWLVVLVAPSAAKMTTLLLLLKKT